MGTDERRTTDENEKQPGCEEGGSPTYLRGTALNMLNERGAAQLICGSTTLKRKRSIVREGAARLIYGSATLKRKNWTKIIPADSRGGRTKGAKTDTLIRFDPNDLNSSKTQLMLK